MNNDPTNNYPLQTPNENPNPDGNPGSGAAPTKRCPHCGTELPANALFCTECGLNLTTGTIAYNAPQPAPCYRDETPLSTGKFLVNLLILWIPIVNLVVPLIWAFSDSTNINRRNFNRALLIMYLISVALSIVMFIAMISIFKTVVTSDFWDQYVVESQYAYSVILSMF